MVLEAQRQSDIYDYKLSVFLGMARKQYFYDVNQRMGRFMKNGILLDTGYPVINLPAKRQLEFNQLMLAFYETGVLHAMNGFLRAWLDERVVSIMLEEQKS